MPYFSCSGEKKQNIVIDETEINSDVSMSTVKMKYKTKALNKVFLNPSAVVYNATINILGGHNQDGYSDRQYKLSANKKQINKQLDLFK